MKVRIERDTLGEAVAWVARALPARPVVPVLAGILLDAAPGADSDSGTLTLSCFDYEVSARITVPVAVGEPGTALVPGRLLAEMVRTLPGEPAEIAADAGVTELTCGGAEFSLVCLPAAEYPRIPGPPAAAGTMDSAEFAIAVSQVVPAASKDDTLPVLTAVCLDIDGDGLTLAATDRYRLAVRKLRWSPAEPRLHSSVLVPARTLAQAARAMPAGGAVSVAFRVLDTGDREAGPDDDLTPGGGVICFQGGGRSFTARLIGGEFVSYASRFPAGFACSAEFDAAAFTAAVRRVAVAADRASPVRLAFADGTARIEAETEGRARAAESVAAGFSGPERAIAFSPRYLLDGLEAATAADRGHAAAPGPEAEEPGAPVPSAGGLGVPGCRIRLEFTDAVKPALITLARKQGSGPAAAPQDSPGAVSAPPAGPGGDTDAADFRYLVVPQRLVPRT